MEYSPVDFSKTSTVSNPPSGLGLYVGKISSDWVIEHTPPKSSEFMKKTYAYTHSPSIERIGNNTVDKTTCN